MTSRLLTGFFGASGSSAISRSLSGFAGTTTTADRNVSAPDVYTLTLHSAAALPGQRVTVTRSGGGKLTRLAIVPAVGESINDGAANQVFVAIDVARVELVSDGTRWISAEARGFDPSDIPDLSHRYEATSVVLGEANTIVTLVDTIAGDSLVAPATVTQRPTYRAVCHEANGHPTVHFYGPNLQRLVANSAANTGNEKHSKMGSTVAIFYVPQQTSGDGVVLDELGGAFTGPGIQYRWSSGGATAYVYRTGALIASRTGPASSFGSGVAAIMRLIPDTTTFDLRTVTTAGTTDSSVAYGSPDYWNPAFALTMGALANGGATHFSGDVACVLVFRRNITDAERVQLAAYMESKYRAAAPAVTASNQSSALAGTFKVLCVGDSITEGSTGASVGQEGGYRKWIYDNLGGTPIDFVGTQAYGAFADNLHNGVSGLAIKTPSGASAAFPGYQDTTLSPGSYDKVMRTLAGLSMIPDVTVVNLGVNNLGAADTSRNLFDHPGDLLELISYIWARSGSRIVLCTLTPADTGSSTRHQLASSFRRALGSVVRELRRRGVVVSVADTFSALTPNAIYLFDGLHPTTVGYNAMGAVILPAIRYAAGIGP